MLKMSDMGCDECPVYWTSELLFSELALRVWANAVPSHICHVVNFYVVNFYAISMAIKVGANAAPTRNGLQYAFK